MGTTSEAESFLSLGISRFDFHRHQQSRVLRQSELREVLPVQVEGNRFLQIAHHLIQRAALSDDGNFEAFGYIARFFTRTNYGFDGVLE